MTKTNDVPKIAVYFRMGKPDVSVELEKAAKKVFPQSEVEVINDFQVLLDNVKKGKYVGTFAASSVQYTRKYDEYLELLIYAMRTETKVYEAIKLKELFLPNYYPIGKISG